MTTQLNPETQTAPAETQTAPPVTPYEPQHDVDTSAVPFRVSDGVHIPAQRHYDQEFAELEYSKMWLHTWQWAIREEYVPSAGDYMEYTIVDKTVIVVRQKDNSIKVLENVCPHRGTRFANTAECGTFGGNQIVCRFHGWRFDLDGSQSYIYGRRGFVPESVDPAELGLKEVRSAVKYGFVWINFDDNAPSLDDFLGTMDDHVAPIGMDRMRVRWWRYTEVPANWKVSMEAFMEAYHVMQSHPELNLGATGDAYSVDGLTFYHHGMGHVDSTPPWDHTQGFNLPDSFVDGMSFGRFFIEQNRVLFEGLDATNTARDEYIADRIRDLPDDELLPRFFEELYTYAQDAKIPMPPLDLNASNYGYIFPNMVFLGFPGNILFYRVRPNGHDPNTAFFEAVALQVPREVDMNNAPPPLEGPMAKDDWPFVLRQDMENIELQQQGYRSGAIDHATISPRYEPMIFSLHSELDRYLATY
ncbi:aromatic ring-hydroxylating oxygenase subunit alpha [Mycolicibacterium pyrenivorans]|uniref:aromatic ring-hydroxylating oxygenase subunit alpha n=1 Tax=Mycolicibacterium pyrenivorans TaxID=187102 RepID=UPI0021F353EA|nr:aromatic ring-hydroxylating dioxygenase subunit alpha [Mycolicibacterium pyrenivorans]MCV7154776.1 aromatic ring-hydroxylating dioxygenase subunit alpha [Mycolicibacterium pyrenivorans]